MTQVNLAQPTEAVTVEVEAFNLAIAALKAGYGDTAEGRKAGQVASASLRTLERAARWAAWVACMVQPEGGARESAANYFGEHVARANPDVKETSIDKFKQRMRLACITYAADLKGVDREKVDPLSKAQSLHTKAANSEEDEATFERAAELAANELGVSVSALMFKIGNGGTLAKETLDRFMVVVRESGKLNGTTFRDTWNAVGDAARNEHARLLITLADAEVITAMETAIITRKAELEAVAEVATRAEAQRNMIEEKSRMAA